MELAGVLAKLGRFPCQKKKKGRPVCEYRAALFLLNGQYLYRFLSYSRDRSVLLKPSMVSLPVTMRSKSELLT
jgi:hypothetical protein